MPPPYPLHARHPENLCDTVGHLRVEQWLRFRSALRSDRWHINATEQDFRLAESQARSALKTACDAYDYIDDIAWDYPEHVLQLDGGELRTLEELLSRCHALAHRSGELVGGVFGCAFEHEDGHWYDRCRLSLMHLRFGSSAGFTARYVCTICKAAVGECLHERGIVYHVTATVTPEGFCDICGDRCEEHDPGATYGLRADLRLADIEMQEVSMVARPRDPLARIQKRSVDETTLRTVLGRVPHPDEHVECYLCMFPCRGFTQFSESAAD